MSVSRREFDRTLEAIEANVGELFGMVADDLPAVTRVLIDGRGDVADPLAERERAVDVLYHEAEELAGRQLLLQAPVASDLRFLLSVLRIVPEIERSHDLVMDIASEASETLARDLSPGARELTERMGVLASAMWRQVADAWRSRDRSTADTLAKREQEMVQLHDSLTAELASGRMAISVAMDMTLVARCYERLGAHAVNIARRIAYLAGGVR
jgi:phosphate transport system protein